MGIKNAFPALIFLILFIPGCKKSYPPLNEYSDSLGYTRSVRLSYWDIKRLGINYKQIPRQKTQKTINCPGYIMNLFESNRDISFASSGTVAAILCTKGQKVIKGQKIAIIQNIDFIELQKEYLDALNQLDFYTEEYKRQGELTVENATSLKKMQVSKRDFQTWELKCKALELQLKAIGICPDSLAYNKLESNVAVYAPSSGVISSVFIRRGSFIEKGKVIAEIKNIKKQGLKINIPEKYFREIYVGKSLVFQLTFDTLSQFNAVIKSLEPEVDPVRHSLVAFAELQDTVEFLMPGMSVNTQIITEEKEVAVVASSTVLNDQEAYYIFAMNNGLFHKVQVKKEGASKTKMTISGLSYEMSDSVIVTGIRRLNSYFTKE